MGVRVDREQAEQAVRELRLFISLYDTHRVGLPRMSGVI